MIRKILIANRGEIACRIIRTCREMGIATVAVYSDADKNALHVQMADEAVHIGAAPAGESYLHIPAIIEAATRTGADAVHPGYGFLSENSLFAQAVIDAGLIFIGPPPHIIEAMGSKREAKRIAQSVGVPVVPGYNEADQSDETLIRAANEIGYPVMVKASAGGGGKGMRLVQNAADFPDALAAARREAKTAFGDDTLLLEKAIENPRHVEIQIFGDTHGNMIALGERECSIQRRHQKIIEEVPSPALDDALRERMSNAAVSIGRALGYVNAGTVEFILDGEKNFYFLEVNTRLQVEHPVTEMVFGLDLVEMQIEIAEGKPLPLPSQEQLYAALTENHAMEVRVYAEDPANEFLPATGTIIRWQEGFGRVDSGVRSGVTITVYYDPMLAKVIVYGNSRGEAIRSLDYALSQLQLLGIRSNIAFLRRILTHPDFIAGDIDTGFIERHPELLSDASATPPVALIAAAIAQTGIAGGHWRNNPYRAVRHQFQTGNQTHTIDLTPIHKNHYRVQIGDAAYEVEAQALESTGDYALTVNGHRQKITVLPADDEMCWVHTMNGTYSLKWVSPLPTRQRVAQAEGTLRAPMPGKVIAVSAADGQAVQQGDVLVIIEAMKMEHRIKAPYSGIVGAIYYGVGQHVEAGVTLLELQRENNGA